MQIINKTKDKMCDYALHIANCNSRYFSRTDIKACEWLDNMRLEIVRKLL